MTWALGASLSLLAACVALVVARPGRIGIATPVAVGAAIALVSGLEPTRAVGSIAALTWDAVATLLGLMILSGALDKAGFFAWCARGLTRAAGGSAPRLWWGLMGLACLCAIVLANDGAMLILVPLYASIAARSGFDRRQTLALLLPTCLLIDVSSVALSTSNLSNLMVADYFHMGFLTYARLMAVPAVASIAACLLLSWRVFGPRMPLLVPDPRAGCDVECAEDPRMLAVCWIALAALAAGLVLSHLLVWPVSVVVGAVALGLLAVALAGGKMRAHDVLRAAPWSIAVFAMGMFVLVDAVARAGGTVLLLGAWGHGGSWRVGATLSLLSSGLDNLPALLMGLLGFAARPGQVPAPEIAAAVVAVDIGCKLTPYGSLATLLWLRLLADRGIHVKWREYLPYGLALTPVIWAIGTAAALASVR